MFSFLQRYTAVRKLIRQLFDACVYFGHNTATMVERQKSNLSNVVNLKILSIKLAPQHTNKNVHFNTVFIAVSDS